MICKYDEAFTVEEMLEETCMCKNCKLDCPNKGKTYDMVMNDFYICGDRIGGVRRFTTIDEFVNLWKNFDMNKSVNDEYNF